MASSTLGGDGVFTTHEPGFARFLSDLGSANPDENALVARNFLLEIGPLRAQLERNRAVLDRIEEEFVDRFAAV